MLLPPQLSLLAGVSGTGEETDPVSQALLPSLCSAWHLPSPPAPRGKRTASLGEEGSVDVNIRCHEPASQEGWVYRGFQKSQENQRTGFPAAASREDRPQGWPSWSPFMMARTGPDKAVSLLPTLVPLNSQKLTADGPQALSSFVISGPWRHPGPLAVTGGQRKNVNIQEWKLTVWKS